VANSPETARCTAGRTARSIDTLEELCGLKRVLPQPRDLHRQLERAQIVALVIDHPRRFRRQSADVHLARSQRRVFADRREGAPPRREAQTDVEMCSRDPS
jgi:hypothetical protein